MNWRKQAADRIPFVIAVVADFSGKGEDKDILVEELEFMEVDRKHFDQVMGTISPKLSLHAPCSFMGNEELKIQLIFRTLDDFHPDRIFNTDAVLCGLKNLACVMSIILLLSKKEGALNKLLEQVLTDAQKRDELKQFLLKLKNAESATAFWEHLTSSQLPSRPIRELLDMLRALYKSHAQGLSETQITTALLSLTAEMKQRLANMTNGVVPLLQTMIAEINNQLAQIMNRILHDRQFQALEATWRGLHYLVCEAETGSDLQIRILDLSKENLIFDFEETPEVYWSGLFYKVYKEAFDQYGAAPYGCLLCDMRFSAAKADVETLKWLAQIGESALTPVIVGASPAIFQAACWADANRPRDLARIFQTIEYKNWRTFCSSTAASWLLICLPDLLARPPYHPQLTPVVTLAFTESTDDPADLLWVTPVYAIGACLANSFHQNGNCINLSGIDHGGRIEGLNPFQWTSASGKIREVGPLSVDLTDRRVAELIELGFTPLSKDPKSGYAYLTKPQTFGANVSRAASKASDATLVATELEHVMVISRLSHLIKIFMREQSSAFLKPDDFLNALEDFLKGYIAAEAPPDSEEITHRPLSRITISRADIDENPWPEFRVLIEGEINKPKRGVLDDQLDMPKKIHMVLHVPVSDASLIP